MTRQRRVLWILCGLVVLGALLSTRAEWAPPPEAFRTSPISDAPLWSSTPQMSAEQNAEHHWRKHGGEFPELRSAVDYEEAAHAFVTHPPPGTLIKHDDRGDTLFYNPATNTFAVRAANGAPRTMFKPDNGMRYWERQ